ncbi:MAG: AMP-binding protein [Deltaproteobacteria bacterium]|nr:AMP-binding protein [Deltaproteobacteria bacterium]
MTLETVPSIFRKTAEKYGDRVSLRKKEYGLWHDISWNEYYRRAKCVGSALISMGLEKGECVSIIGDNCPEWVIIDLGIQGAGGVAVGVYSTNAWPQVEYVVDQSESKFFFVENEEQLDKWLHFRDKVPGLQKVIVWDLEGLRHFEDPMVMTYDELLETGCEIAEKTPGLFEKRMSEVTPEDLSVLIYTSGTTGPPKGAMLTHRNVTWMARAIVADDPVYDIRHGRRYVFSAPVSCFRASLFGLCACHPWVYRQFYRESGYCDRQHEGDIPYHGICGSPYLGEIPLCRLYQDV